MKRSLLLFGCMGALCLTALAQDDAAYQGWMKTIGGTGGSLRKNLDAKNGDGAAADAGKLKETMALVEDYWKKKGVDDAAKIAVTAEESYGEVATMASAGKFDEASASLKKAGATCGACHSVHREKAADGTYKIK
jgi:cytochrome c556